jgi:hypothetical protein
VLPGVPRLSGRKESVTTSALISGGAVTLLCELIPKSHPAPVIHLAGLSKVLKNISLVDTALVHKTAHANVHRDTQSQEREQYRGSPVTH